MRGLRDEREPVKRTEMGGRQVQEYSKNGKRLVWKREITLGGFRWVKVEAKDL